MFIENTYRLMQQTYLHGNKIWAIWLQRGRAVRKCMISSNSSTYRQASNGTFLYTNVQWCNEETSCVNDNDSTDRPVMNVITERSLLCGEWCRWSPNTNSLPANWQSCSYCGWPSGSPIKKGCYCCVRLQVSGVEASWCVALWLIIIQ